MDWVWCCSFVSFVRGRCESAQEAIHSAFFVANLFFLLLQFRRVWALKGLGWLCLRPWVTVGRAEKGTKARGCEFLFPGWEMVGGLVSRCFVWVSLCKAWVAMLCSWSTGATSGWRRRLWCFNGQKRSIKRKKEGTRKLEERGEWQERLGDVYVIKIMWIR